MTYQTLGTLRSWMDVFVCYVYLRFHIPLFHSYGDIAIIDEGLQILTYTWHSWPLSSEGSLACHIYCDMGHPFIMVISEDTHAYCQAFGSGAVTTCFYDLGLLPLGFKHQTFCMQGQRSNRLRHHGDGHLGKSLNINWTNIIGTDYVQYWTLKQTLINNKYGHLTLTNQKYGHS